MTPKTIVWTPRSSTASHKRELQKLLREEREIVSLDSASHALMAALALEMLYAGKNVKAKLVAGAWKQKEASNG